MLAFESSKPMFLGIAVLVVALWALSEVVIEFIKHRRGKPSAFDETPEDIRDRIRDGGAVTVGKEILAEMDEDEEDDDDDVVLAGEEPITATPEEMVFIFAMTGYEEELQTLLDSGISVDVRDEDGRTPLMYVACECPTRDSEAAQELPRKIDGLLDLRGDDNTDTWIERESTPVRMTRYLLDHGADVNARDKAGRTPLIHAANNIPLEKGVPHPGVAITGMLLEAGADINAADDEGRTALHHAAMCGEEKTVKALLEAGADDKLRTKNGRDFADCLAEGSLADMLRSVLTEQKLDLEAPDAQGHTRLMRLHGFFQAESAKVLLELGANVDAKDKYCVSVYDHVLRNGRTELAVPFIGRGKPVPDTKDRKELFHTAAAMGDIKAMQRLMDHFKAEPDSEEMLTSLRKAALEGQCAMVEFLLAAGVDPNAVPEDSSWNTEDAHEYEEGVHAKGTLLLNVLQNEEHQDIPTIRALLKAGANVHRWDFIEDCNECLQAVAGCGTLEILQMLVDAGVDPAKSNADKLLEYAAMDAGNPVMLDYILDNLETTDEGKTSALDYAIVNGNVKMAEHLIARGAKVGESTMESAAESDKPAGLRWLIDHGYKGDWGDLLLHAAAEMRAEQVRMLLAQGADVKAKDDEGQTALMRAICTYDYPAFAREAIVRDLLAAGADPNTRDNEGEVPITGSLKWNGFWGRRIIPMLVKAGAKIPKTNAKGKPLSKLLERVDLPAPILKALEDKG